MDTSPRAGGPARLLVATLAVPLALAGSLALAGCAALRVESGHAPTPTAGPVEDVRQRQALASAAIHDAASAVRGSLPADDPAGAALAEAAAAASTHLAALGGIWVPFPDETAATASPSDAGEAGSSPATDVADVVRLLTDESASARADAAAVDDGRLARVLGAVAVQRSLAADRLAAAAGVEPPSHGTPVPPDGVPTGLSAEALAPAIASEDALGVVWELIAARSAGAERESATALAVAHRHTAEAWARAAGVALTDADPRRVAYDLPAQLLDPAADAATRRDVAAALESDLAGVWLVLAAQAAPTTRTPLLDAFAAASATATSLTGELPELPGID